MGRPAIVPIGWGGGLKGIPQSDAWDMFVSSFVAFANKSCSISAGAIEKVVEAGATRECVERVEVLVPIESMSELTAAVQKGMTLDTLRIVKQRGKGKKAEFLVKWVGSLDQTWEPRGNLAKWGAGDLIKEFSAPKKPPTRRSGRRVAGAFLAGAQLDEHHKAVEELISKQGVKGTVEDWLPGYSTELSGVIAKRLSAVPEP